MKGDAKIVALLNEALKLELTAVNQYFLHARMHESWGLSKLAAKIYEESIDEMKHADDIVKRILFLDGLPNLQDLDKLFIGEDVKETLECDLKIEQKAHPFYREAATYCHEAGDYVTRELFDTILAAEEEHIDWIDTQLDLISKIGIQNYMQANI